MPEISGGITVRFTDREVREILRDAARAKAGISGRPVEVRFLVCKVGSADSVGATCKISLETSRPQTGLIPQGTQ